MDPAVASASDHAVIPHKITRCDRCRQRKIKCTTSPGGDKCDQCQKRDLECRRSSPTVPNPRVDTWTSPPGGPRTPSLGTSQKRKGEEPADHRSRKSVRIDLTVQEYESTGDNSLGTFRKSLQHLQGFDKVLEDLEAKNRALGTALEQALRRENNLVQQADESEALRRELEEMKRKYEAVQAERENERQATVQSKEQMKAEIDDLQRELEKAEEQISMLVHDNDCAERKNRTLTDFQDDMAEFINAYVTSCSSSSSLFASVIRSAAKRKQRNGWNRGADLELIMERLRAGNQSAHSSSRKRGTEAEEVP